MKKSKLQTLRLVVQAFVTALTNGYVAGFAKGGIYKGPLKYVCVPGLNCYSCPGALGSCPLGSLQATLGDRSYKLTLYVTGFLLVFGASLGRFVCGWLCPFGMVEDLLYKIPLPKKPRRAPHALTYIRYGVLGVFVILLPLLATDAFGQGEPYFCKLICPAGTLGAGIPLALLNPGIRSAIGPLYFFKLGVLAVIIVLSIVFYRPFCRWLCPLGAIYGMCNKVSLVRLAVDDKSCVDCGGCARACPLGVDPVRRPDSADCIRCGRCVSACPASAITIGVGGKAIIRKDGCYNKTPR